MNEKEYSILMSQNSYKTMEEALLVMMEDKRVNPHGILFLCPCDKEEEKEWDAENAFVTNNSIITNIPYLNASMDDRVYGNDDLLSGIDKVADENAYVTEVARRIRKNYNVDVKGGWSLTALSLYDENAMSVFLLVAPESWEEMKSLVNAYNAQASANGYSALSLNDKDMAISGEFSKRSERGGFFEKRKIKKQNKEQYINFLRLINKVIDHLRRV